MIYCVNFRCYGMHMKSDMCFMFANVKYKRNFTSDSCMHVDTEKVMFVITKSYWREISYKGNYLVCFGATNAMDTVCVAKHQS